MTCKHTATEYWHGTCLSNVFLTRVPQVACEAGHCDNAGSVVHRERVPVFQSDQLHADLPKFPGRLAVARFSGGRLLFAVTAHIHTQTLSHNLSWSLASLWYQLPSLQNVQGYMAYRYSHTRHTSICLSVRTFHLENYWMDLDKMWYMSYAL
jgi:hypothetical protein